MISNKKQDRKKRREFFKADDRSRILPFIKLDITA
jgi:hypothetical protein